MPKAELRGILGLAMRAGHLTPGAEMSLQLIRDGKAALVLADEGASAGTLKKIADACAFRGVNLVRLAPGELAQALGRDTVAAAALRKGSFARRAEEICGEGPASDNAGTKNSEEIG